MKQLSSQEDQQQAHNRLQRTHKPVLHFVEIMQIGPYSNAVQFSFLMSPECACMAATEENASMGGQVSVMQNIVQEKQWLAEKELV